MTDLDLLPDAPADDAAPLRTDLSADAAWELLRAGKTVTGARVRGLKFRGPVPHPVRFSNCTLVKPEFDGAAFADTVSFSNCTLDRLLCGKSSAFAKDLDFGHSVLNKVNLSRLTVAGKFLAPHAEFRGKLVFSDCEFTGRASFWEARFATWVDFTRCRLRAETDF